MVNKGYILFCLQKYFSHPEAVLECPSKTIAFSTNGNIVPIHFIFGTLKNLLVCKELLTLTNFTLKHYTVGRGASLSCYPQWSFLSIGNVQIHACISRKRGPGVSRFGISKQSLSIAFLPPCLLIPSASPVRSMLPLWESLQPSQRWKVMMEHCWEGNQDDSDGCV